MLIFEDDRSICLWPEELVASITPVYPDRLRVVTHDGLVGYMPAAALPEGPWQPVESGLVHPNHLQSGEKGMMDPAGFVYPIAQLPVGAAWNPPVHWGCELTAQGPVWKGQSVSRCPQVPSDWLQVSNRLRIHPDSARRLQFDSSELQLVLDNGTAIPIARAWRERLLLQLGLSDARHLQPYRKELFTPFLREYPFEIARASAAVLKAHFTTARQLIFQVIWQALTYRLQGIDAGYSDTHRGFLYNPLAATLTRAGLWSDASTLLYAEILGDLVGTDRLFTYQQLGFQDIFSQFREIGTRRPDIVLFIEKDSLSRTGIELARRLSISWLISGGISHLGSVEYFTAALRKVYQGPVLVIVYGDFDPGGRVAGLSFGRHLERYHTPCAQPPHFLVTPDLFTAEELELFARPLSAKNDRVDDWVLRTGGIHGQPLGIHADWLPAERVHQALLAWLQLITEGKRPE